MSVAVAFIRSPSVLGVPYAVHRAGGEHHDPRIQSERQPDRPLAAPDRVIGTVTVLTLWAYRRRLHGTSGGWRWVALSLRLMAILLCLLAALRPSVALKEKQRQKASLIFLVDRTHAA